MRIARRPLLIIVRVVPISHPLPDVALEILHALNAGSLRMASHRFESGAVAPLIQVVGLGASRFAIAPWKAQSRCPARGAFPFGFCGQTPAGPRAVRLRVDPIHIDDRMVGEHSRKSRALPQAQCLIPWMLGNAMAGGCDEFKVPRIRDFEGIEIKRIEENAPLRIFVPAAVPNAERRPHDKFTGRNQRHRRAVLSGRHSGPRLRDGAGQ